MGNIVLLDDLTINKIAAGEVIERPASVIKEMVENSIDAGANNITVEIKNGGISYIKVTDNGKGIAQDDMEIAFERHATSKIRSAEDLSTVTSMGFRGEALASIAAIANVEMISKTENQEIGYRIVVEGGDVLEKEEAGCRTGTSITVKNLFFNTPVRYKFLKKDYTESGYIEDAITRIALVHPEISIKLINTGKTIIQTNGSGDLKSVIYNIYGKNIAEGILPIKYEYEDIKVEGVIGKPEIARSNRSNQLFFVNKRYIKDKTLSAATEQAYKGMIPIGKFGFVVLDIEMNPAKVDVNVHPAKLEVRFEEESKVFQAVYHAIKDALLKGDLVADTAKEGETLQNDKGLFQLRNTNNGQIRAYIEKESEIKTNAKEEKENIKKDIANIITDTGKPINTADILEKLKTLRQTIKKEVEENPGIKLNNNYIEMDKQLTNKENSEKEEIEKTVEVNAIIENNQEENDKEKDKDSTQNILSEEVENKNVNIETAQNNKTNNEQNEQENNIESNQDININQENENNQENQYSEKQETSENSENTQNTTPQEKEIEDKKETLKELEKQIEKIEDNKNNEPLDFDEMYQKLFNTKPIKEEPKEENKTNAIDIVKDNTSLFEEIEEYKKVPYKFIGIVFKTYIILEMGKEMYILDQHAAHERIMYEKVKKNYYSDSSKDSQMLLLPDVITLTHKEMDIAKENIPMFEKAGFSLEEFGENTIKLTGVPTVCIDLDTKELFLETLDEINTVARTAKQEKEEKFIATVACKAAVKAHMALTKEEVDSLMDKLLELPNPFTCPHGRPTAIKMTQYDIEKKFARKL